MRIGMILKSTIPPPDIRVEKEAGTLLASGHDVYLLLERKGGEEVEEVVYGIKFNRLVHMGKLREKLHRYTFSFTFKDAMWHRAIERFAVANRVEVLHVHDLPLVGEAVSVGKKLGIPVVADLHENYPAGLQVWYTSRFKKWTIYNFRRWAKYEREVLRKVDRIVVVIEESKERIKGLGISEDKIYVVPNTASKERIDIEPVEEIIDRYRDNFVVSYIGGFAPHRGLDIVVKSAGYLKDRIENLKVVLVGNRNRKYMNYLKALAERLGCEQLVDFPGWQSFKRIWSYIRVSDICLVPHARNPHTDTTIPHKLFQYMMLAKPVIVSDCPPLRRIIEDSGGGLWFRYNDSGELADKIFYLYRNGEKRKMIGQAGQQAFYDRYNWDATSRPLVDLYDRLMRERGKT